MTNNVEKLASLRTALKHYSLDAYIIPLSDLHLSENIPDHWRIIKWLTGFTGSAATVVVTDSSAGLWTDSRYFIQDEKQLVGSGFELVKPKAFYTSDFIDVLSENMNSGCRIAFDG